MTRALGRRALPWALAAGLAGPAHRFVGTWRGVIEGAETATAVGRVALPARLTVAEDGTWALEDPQNGPARGTGSRPSGRPASSGPRARSSRASA